MNDQIVPEWKDCYYSQEYFEEISHSLTTIRNIQQECQDLLTSIVATATNP